MFKNYKVMDDTLYLFIDDKYEMASFNTNNKKESVIENIKRYIKDNKIKFDGVKVILMLSGIVLSVVYLNRDSKIDNPNITDRRYVYDIVNLSRPNVINEKNNSDVKTNVSDTIKENKDAVKNNDNTYKITSNVASKKVENSAKKEDAVSTNNKTTPINEVKKSIMDQRKMISVKRSNGVINTMYIEDYLIGVVASEMPALYNTEALKAQAVVARTYTLKLMDSNRVLTDDTNTQIYKDDEELRSMWGNKYDEYYKKIKAAVYDTKGVCVTYDGKIIDAVYHSTSNGYTEDSINVWGNSYPYLKSVPSNLDTFTSSYLKEVLIPYDKVSSLLGFIVNPDSQIEIISKNNSGRISKIKISDKEYTGVELRNLLGLRSADFDYVKTNEGIVFTTRGYGHGVGMSQVGANEMAKKGYSYKDILKYYYTGVEVVNYY